VIIFFEKIKIGVFLVILKKLVLMLLTMQVCIVFASAATLYVDDNGIYGNYTTIQSAVDASMNGDIIYVNGGTYPETVQITQSNLVFKGQDYPTVDGFENQISPEAGGSGTQYTTIDSFKIVKSGITISGKYSYQNLIRNNHFSNCWLSLVAEETAQKDQIINNEINNGGISLNYGNGGKNCKILGNRIYNSDIGINLEGMNQICEEIGGNIIQGCNVGLSISGPFAGVQHVYNNIFNNTQNVKFSDETVEVKVWNLAKLIKYKNIIGGPYQSGNFWGNPSGTGFSQTHSDINGDGIAEEAYIDGKNIDYFPLVTPNKASAEPENNSTAPAVTPTPDNISTDTSSSSGSSDSSSSSDSSGGSHHSSGEGSGGGAGGSPEPQNNVEIKELSQAFITSGKNVVFSFTKNATCVVSISFDSKKTFGKTTTIAEQLKNKSALVLSLPEGDVYKSFNIWVGNGGVASEKNIENPLLNFKVAKSWIEEQDIDPSSITLNRYNEKTWNQIKAEETGEDEEYIYFTSKVPGYNSFSVTGVAMQKAALENASKVQVNPGEVNIAANAAANETKEPETKKNNAYISVVIVIGCLIGSYFLLREIN
jgi:PGF-pre-PGF domain-containing protein